MQVASLGAAARSIMTKPSADDAIAMIRESAARVVDRHDLGRIRALRFTPTGFDRTTWRAMCELGWPALRIAEEAGGVGLGMTEYCVLAMELGAALAPEPLIAAALVARSLSTQRAPLEAVLAGDLIVLPAWQETPNTLTPGTQTTLAHGRLYGRKRFVPLAGGADAFLVTTADGCVLVDCDAPHLSLSNAATQDGGHYGTLEFDGVRGARIDANIDLPLAEATLATAAYLAGMIDAAIARTVDYLCTRVQFGAPLGSFQALQHRMVDLKLQALLTHASVEDAAAQWDLAPGTTAASAAISRAKARASDAALLVTRQAIQLHGGIGYADEHDIGLYLRKAMVLAPAYGGSAVHRQHYAALAPETDG